MNIGPLSFTLPPYRYRMRGKHTRLRTGKVSGTFAVRTLQALAKTNRRKLAAEMKRKKLFEAFLMP